MRPQQQCHKKSDTAEPQDGKPFLAVRCSPLISILDTGWMPSDVILKILTGNKSFLECLVSMIATTDLILSR